MFSKIFFNFIKDYFYVDRWTNCDFEALIIIITMLSLLHFETNVRQEVSFTPQPSWCHLFQLVGASFVKNGVMRGEAVGAGVDKEWGNREINNKK